MTYILNILLYVVVISNVCRSFDDKYIIIDGIKVLREEHEDFLKRQDEKFQMKQKTKAEIEMELELQLAEKEDKSYARKFPKKIHVCRIFSDEFTKRIQSSSFGEIIDGHLKNEYLFSKSLRESCNSIKEYTVTRTSTFRYKKGKSILRRTFDQAQQLSKVKEWTYNIPNEEIDDPTGEIRRLYEDCEDLIQEYKEILLGWLLNGKRKSLYDLLCKEIELSNYSIESQDDRDLSQKIKIEL